MELKIIHFYPDLMSLYGSYANVAVLKRQLHTEGAEADTLNDTLVNDIIAFHILSL